jgi:hypothetical protein
MDERHALVLVVEAVERSMPSVGGSEGWPKTLVADASRISLEVFRAA